jgi:hypothetical protein
MMGLLWNIRGLNKNGRHTVIVNRIRCTHADFVGITETKKESFSQSYLDSLAGIIPFNWFYLPAKRTAGGILLGCNSDKFIVDSAEMLNFSVSLMVRNKDTDSCWKLVVVYGSPYENGKAEFIAELHAIMNNWQGPILIGGDFNLVQLLTRAMATSILDGLTFLMIG